MSGVLLAFVLAVHVFTCIALMASILLQSGKGGGLAGAFGAGSSQTLFGGRGAASFLSRATTVLSVVFFVTSLTLGLSASRGGMRTSSLTQEEARRRSQQRPVTEIIAERAPATLRLAVAATLISVIAGVAMGALAARRPGSLVDHAMMATAVLGISTPVFWLGMMLSLVFAVTLGWLPVSGYGDGDVGHLLLPALTLGALHTGSVARMTRGSLLEVARQDYMTTARAKGLAEPVLLVKHALRNAAIPIVTVIGIGLADLLVGAPLTETVFAWPGLGRLLVASVGQRDLPVVMGAVLVFALVYVVANLLVDLAYLVVDPRTRST